LAHFSNRADLPDHSQVSASAQAGDRDAMPRLLSLVYAELHRLAQAHMARLPPGQTLQTTALVHEAYLRLAGKADLQPEGRKHFFFAAARAIRSLPVNNDVKANAQRRARARDRRSLVKRVRSYLFSIQFRREYVRAYFRDAPVTYAA
jgi:hypothetical protein